MLKTSRLQLHISRSSYSPQELRLQIESFLVKCLTDNVWLHRMQMVASEVIANSCEHRFDDDYVDFVMTTTCFKDKVRIQILLEDYSNLLIMQRYNNLVDAVKKHKLGKSNARGVHGRGLHIILNWTDRVDFSKKRSGGLKLKAIKTIVL